MRINMKVKLIEVMIDEDISHNAYRRFKVKILKRTTVNSYYVYKCPEFIRG